MHRYRHPVDHVQHGGSAVLGTPTAQRGLLSASRTLETGIINFSAKDLILQNSVKHQFSIISSVTRVSEQNSLQACVDNSALWALTGIDAHVIQLLTLIN